MKIVAVRVPEEVKKKMQAVPEDWSNYLRNAIEERLRKEEQRTLLKKLDRITARLSRPPKGTGAKIVRGDRDRG